jgi:ATP-dependent DNA helicase RecG
VVKSRRSGAKRVHERHGRINNTVVQQQLSVSKPTATRNLGELEKGGYLQKTGTCGAGTEYRLIGA